MLKQKKRKRKVSLNGFDFSEMCLYFFKDDLNKTSCKWLGFLQRPVCYRVEFLGILTNILLEVASKTGEKKGKYP